MVLEGSFEYVNLWRYGVHVHNLKINIPEEKAKCRVLYIKYECKVTIVRNLDVWGKKLCGVFMFAYLKQKSVPLTFNIWRHVRSASRNSWSLEESPAWHFSCILFTLSLDFFFCPGVHGLEMGQEWNKEVGREQSGGLLIPQHPCVEYENISWHNVLVQYASLKETIWKNPRQRAFCVPTDPPHPHPTPSFVCFDWAREREREWERRGKKGRCARTLVGTEKGQYTPSPPQTARRTGAQVSSKPNQQKKRRKGRGCGGVALMNHGILSSLAPNFVTCSLLSLSLWGKKTLSLLGERGERVRGMRRTGAEEEGNSESLCLSRWQTSVAAAFSLGEGCRLAGVVGVGVLAGYISTVVTDIQAYCPDCVEPALWPCYRLELHCVTLEGVSN